VVQSVVQPAVQSPALSAAAPATNVQPMFPPVRVWVHGPEYARDPMVTFDLAARDEMSVDERKCS